MSFGFPIREYSYFTQGVKLKGIFISTSLMCDVDLKSMKEIKGMSLAFFVCFWGLK